MTRFFFQFITLFWLAALTLSGSLWGASFTTKSGRALEEAQILGIAQNQAVVSHAGGIEIMKLSDLPDELLDAYHTERETPQALQEDRNQLVRKCIDLSRETELLKERIHKLGGTGAEAGQRIPAKPAGTTARKTTALATPPYITCEEIERDFLANTVEAGKKYKGLLLKISGVIEEFDSSLLDRNTIMIGMKSTTGRLNIRCNFHLEDLIRSYLKNVQTQKLDIRRNEKRIVLLTLVGDGSRYTWIEDKTVMRVGENILFDGMCDGLSVTTVKFSNCRKLDQKAVTPPSS